MTKFEKITQIQYNEQLDYLLLWIESCPHKVKNEILEKVLINSNINQINLLWTALQPASHRDYYYSGQMDYPGYSFTKLSTPITRLFKRATSSQDIKTLSPPLVTGFVTDFNSKEISNRTVAKQILAKLRHQDPEGVAESKEILLEHMKRNKRAASVLFCQRDDVFKFNEQYNNICAIEEKYLNTKRQSIISGSFLTLSDGKSNSKSGKLDTIDYESLQKKANPPAVLIAGQPVGTRNLNPKKWLPDLQIKPHVIRFPKLPVRRHVQENSYMTTPMPSETFCSVLTLSSRQQQEKEDEINRKSQLKLEILDTPSKPVSVNSTLYNFQEKKKPDLIASTSFPNFANLPKEDYLNLVELFLFWYTEVWTDVERNDFLCKLLLKLDARQHYFMFTYLATRQYRDFVTGLPQNLSMKILKYLTPKELIIASRVCKNWKNICQSSELWEAKCKDIVIELPALQPIGNIEWRKLFRQNEMLKKNWSTGKCRVIQCKGHKNKYSNIIKSNIPIYSKLVFNERF